MADSGGIYRSDAWESRASLRWPRNKVRYSPLTAVSQSSHQPAIPPDRLLRDVHPRPDKPRSIQRFSIVWIMLCPCTLYPPNPHPSSTRFFLLSSRYCKGSDTFAWLPVMLAIGNGSLEAIVPSPPLPTFPLNQFTADFPWLAHMVRTTTHESFDARTGKSAMVDDS
ncbi:hypothetical protein EJ05DRAFT_273159 [Pseudovirgaria hyperparasitica]|uniref:Uncharacterized protein n=1 Tax=Pseudovirgaria hyperparasitica TaxID=470096 RepID=A0A6A6WDJ0_9PEZI|nr:uncharacterized protein EJ05DRAFT_273159 [Pseudovirgaria hyperparasitica]KAF2760124.1 hypothetical protein EJ05DRAFT_273159 [Pseudovirgaria hyperparasitica]